MEVFNVRGNECTQCQVMWWQSPNGYRLHSDVSKNHCNDPSPAWANIPDKALPGGEDYFAGSTTAFDSTGNTCAQSQTSTFNWWFGDLVINKAATSCTWYYNDDSSVQSGEYELYDANSGQMYT